MSEVDKEFAEAGYKKLGFSDGILYVRYKEGKREVVEINLITKEVAGVTAENLGMIYRKCKELGFYNLRRGESEFSML